MEKFNVDYSTKIIPIPTKHENAITFESSTIYKKNAMGSITISEETK